MSARRDAAYLLGAATLVCLLVAGSVHPYIAPSGYVEDSRGRAVNNSVETMEYLSPDRR